MICLPGQGPADGSVTAERAQTRLNVVELLRNVDFLRGFLKGSENLVSDIAKYLRF